MATTVVYKYAREVTPAVDVGSTPPTRHGAADAASGENATHGAQRNKTLLLPNEKQNETASRNSRAGRYIKWGCDVFTIDIIIILRSVEL